ncbi:MAG: Uma2 family endonuclease [Verrucomicrobiota bacterium]
MQLVIELPPRGEQIAFNRRRWEEVCADRTLARLPGKIETNAHGTVLMMPPPSGNHSSRQGEIAFILRSLLGGRAIPECPISTIDGVRAADVGWYSDARFARVQGQIAFETAPEICVEVISPSNTPWEMREKRQLYFEAGAEEVWLCAEDGAMSFFHRAEPDEILARSFRCPEFPQAV